MYELVLTMYEFITNRITERCAHLLQDRNFSNRRSNTIGIATRLLGQGSCIQISCNCGYGLILCCAVRRGLARNHQFTG